MNKKILVKKIWSLNPTKFKKITLDEASKKYYDYVMQCLKEETYFKSFVEWLENEI